MQTKSSKEYLQEDVKTLTKRIKDLREEYEKQYEKQSVDLKNLPGIIEEQKRFNAEIIESQQRHISASSSRIEELDKRYEDVSEAILIAEEKLKETHDKHREISKRLLTDLMQKQKNIDLLSNEERELIERNDIAQKALNELIDMRVNTDGEHGHLVESINNKREKLNEINKDLMILISNRDSTDQEIKDNRELILKNQDERKELSIRLHDVKVLELRLKPEFQAMLKSYLEKKYG